MPYLGTGFLWANRSGHGHAHNMRLTKDWAGASVWMRADVWLTGRKVNDDFSGRDKRPIWLIIFYLFVCLFSEKRKNVFIANSPMRKASRNRHKFLPLATRCPSWAGKSDDLKDTQMSVIHNIFWRYDRERKVWAKVTVTAELLDSVHATKATWQTKNSASSTTVYV